MSSVSLDSNKLKTLFGAYYDRRMFRILLLGIISGFPWVLIGSALSLWLKEEGLSRSTIGWAGLIFGVYAINFLWAPIIDRLKLPFLTNKIGHRKSIIIFMQTIILVSLILWSTLEPTQNLALVIGIGLAIAISSATQDITIDALRIEQINKEETSSMAAGAAMAVVGWWTGFKLGGFICLEIAERLHKESLAIEREIGFPRGEANSLGSLGNIAAARGNLEKAEGLYKESLAIFKEIGDTKQAIKFYNQIIDFKENFSWKIWKGLLKCLIENKQWSELLKVSLRAKKYYPNKAFLDFTISGCLLKNGKLNEAIYFYQSGKKTCQVPDRLIKSFPEFTENKTLLV